MNTLEQRLESLRDGVGDMQCGLPGDEGHCTAVEVIDAALAELRGLRGEVERHRMTTEEREAVNEGIWACEDITYGRGANQAEADTLRKYIDRTKEGE